MSSQVAGATIANLWEIEAATKAGRVTMRDLDYGSRGVYAVGGSNGASAMAANLTGGSPIFSLRWGDATNLGLIRRVTLSAACGVTAFTAGAAIFNLFVARSFSGSDTGGTSILPSGNQNKLRTSGMGTTLITDLRISATGALSAGTRTLDSNPIASIIGGCPAVAGQQIVPPFAMWDQRPGEHPCLLAQNEGIVIQATVPATGVWFFSVKVDIAEILTY